MPSESAALSPGPRTLGLAQPPSPSRGFLRHWGLVLQGHSQGRGEKAEGKRIAFCLSMHSLPFLSGEKMLSFLIPLLLSEILWGAIT